MFITVQLLIGYQKPLLYAVPDSWKDTTLVGKIVRVPLRNTICPAVVIIQHHHKPTEVTYTIKSAHTIEPFPSDINYNQFIAQLAAYYQIDSVFFIKRMRHFIEFNKQKNELSFKQQTDIHENQNKNIVLTLEQQKVVDFIHPHIKKSTYIPLLLHGVTGSGKTEIYKKAIEYAITQKKSVLLLLPEVTLARQFTKIMEQQLNTHIPIYSFHSGTGIKEKRILWQNLLTDVPQVIIGVHLPVLLPINNLGLIIVDEEHEAGYQEKKNPKINSKEAALIRAQLYKVPIILGSATPSIASLYNIKKRSWHFFQLKKRFAGAFPTIKTVLLNDKKKRKQFWISNELYDAIKQRLINKEQTIIFLNRRGISFFVQCKNCSFIFECHSCSVSLTLHDYNTLTCHYCGYHKKLTVTCPACANSEFLKKGIGTQKMVTILQKMFPHARIARADVDITSKKKLWQQTIADLNNGTIDILVGTQSITKGFHFPRVTLVGIIWADLNLHFPHYTASEQTLQQLIQVAGRAGRQSAQSTVIVQAMHDHPIFAHLDEQQYLHFYEQEISTRNTIGYPPYTRLVEIELKHTNELIIEKESHRLIEALVVQKRIKQLDARILGPAKPLVHKVQKNYRRTIYIKAPNMQTITALFAKVDKTSYKSSIFFTPNPTH